MNRNSHDLRWTFLPRDVMHKCGLCSYHIISYHIKFTHNTTLEHMQTTYISNKSKCMYTLKSIPKKIKMNKKVQFSYLEPNK